MNLFYLLVCVMIIGFGIIGLVIVLEKKKETPDVKDTAPIQPTVAPQDLLNRLGLEKSQKSLPEKPMALPPLFKKPNPPSEPTPTLLQDPLKAKNLGEPITKPISATPAQGESDLSLKHDELLTQHKNLQEKFAKLEILFAEKSVHLERSEKNLINELKNQKEFNKLKDLLEKELKETKEKAKTLQAEIIAAQTENQTSLKRVSQLEEKVKKLEVSVLTSEAAINDAQSDTQLARKRVAELEEKLRANEQMILEKNQKIEDLVKRLNVHPPPQETAAIAETPSLTVQPTSEIIPQPPQKPPSIVPEIPEKQGGGDSLSKKREELDPKHDQNEEPKPETLTLPPDIFADQKDKPAAPQSLPEFKKDNTNPSQDKSHS